jgi:hypothetical protein
MFEKLFDAQKQYFDAIDSVRPEIEKAGKQLKDLVAERFKKLYVKNASKIPKQAFQKPYAWLFKTDRVNIVTIGIDGDLYFEFVGYGLFEFTVITHKRILIDESLLTESGRIEFADEWEQTELQKIQDIKHEKAQKAAIVRNRIKDRIEQI